MAKIKLRRDTYQNWYNANPILGLGEPSFDTTNKAFKVGDGLTVWRELIYTAGIDSTKLPLSGGTLTGGLTGINAVFVSLSTAQVLEVSGRIQVKGSVPDHSYGAVGDRAGMVTVDANHIYYCTADYVNTTTNIWKRTEHGTGTW